MEAGVIENILDRNRNGSESNEKNVSCNRSGINETNVADMEAGVMKICC